MKRLYDVRVSKRINDLLEFARVATHASDGRKPTKAKVAEEMLDLGAIMYLKRYDMELPHVFRPERSGQTTKA